MERTLYHYPFCPFSRKVRLTLGESKLNHTLIMARPWVERALIKKLNPAKTIPILVEETNVFSHSQAICEYLIEEYGKKQLLGTSAIERAEIRRVTAWFDESFFHDVVDTVVFEKTVHRAIFGGSPDSMRMRRGLVKLLDHLTYMSFLLERRSWLTGPNLTLGDLSAGAHMSTLDYFGHIPWDDFPMVKEWYMRLKSRPSFRGLLTDTLPAFKPVEHYADLDF